MIIFGSRSMTSTRGGGAFNCPRCGMSRQYRHVGVNRWFTLYFIPVIPMGTVGEYVECTSCAGTFGVEALSYDPEQDRAEVIGDIRRSLSLLVMSLGTLTQRQFDVFCEAFRELLGVTPAAHEIQRDIDDARMANANMQMFVSQRLGSLSIESRKAVMWAGTLIAAANGNLGPHEQHALGQFGAALMLGQPVISEIINRRR